VTRLTQLLAGATGLSRRAADTAITAGRITIDGRPATLGDRVEEGSTVTLDGRPVTPPATRTYLALHKPTGYVSSRVRQGQDPTIYELLPAEYRKLRPAGRLDRDSSGLMLLSDDGDFIHRLTHPSHDKAKIYELTLARPLTPADTQRLETGVQLDDGPSRLSVLHTDGPQVTVSLSEGRNRQLRRTLGALGYTVTRLHRTSIGPYQLGGLAPGKYLLINTRT
jgi:23S rRNA pseudouridine2605 synthase